MRHERVYQTSHWCSDEERIEALLKRANRDFAEGHYYCNLVAFKESVRQTRKHDPRINIAG